MKSVLIGGTGFIGSALAEQLVRTGESVLALSRRGEGSVVGVRYARVDASDTRSLANLLKEGDRIFILTGQNGPAFDAEREKELLQSIATSIQMQKNKKKVFYFSSTLVYGNSEKPSEETDECHPIEPYSKFKLDAEDILKASVSNHTLGIFRIGNVYGSPKNQGFIGLLMRRYFEKRNEPLRINGDGHQLRDYIFLDDVLEAVLAVADKLTRSDTVNIASGNSFSLLDIVKEVSKVARNDILFEVTGTPLEEASAIRVSVERLRRKYGYVPRHSLEVGLQKTFSRYRTDQPLGSAVSLESRDALHSSPPVSGKLSGKRILFLGGEGFIGRNLISYFSEENECVSVGTSRSPFPVRAQDVFLRKNPYEEEIGGDYDIIVHLIDNKVPADVFCAEEKKLIRNLPVSRKTHFIVFSSAVVYANPHSDYGRRKLSLEAVFSEYCRGRGIPLTILRPFNTFGPFQIPYRQGGLVANLLYNFLSGKSTDINDMDAKRDFIYVADIARYVEYVAFHRKQGTFDIGFGKLFTLRDFISLLERDIFKEKARIVPKDIRECVVNRSAKHMLLETKLLTDIRQGLLETLEFYRRNENVIAKLLSSQSV